jgi:hypothetical protein
VDIRAEGRPRQAELDVQQGHTDPAEPRVTRVDEAVPPTRQGRRSADESGHVRVAADDPVEGDKVGRVDLIRESDEVAGEVADAVGVATEM